MNSKNIFIHFLKKFLMLNLLRSWLVLCGQFFPSDPRLKISLLGAPRPQDLEARKVAFLGKPVDRFFVNIQERRNVPNGHGWFHNVWHGHPPSASSLTENWAKLFN